MQKRKTLEMSRLSFCFPFSPLSVPFEASRRRPSLTSTFRSFNVDSLFFSFAIKKKSQKYDPDSLGSSNKPSKSVGRVPSRSQAESASTVGRGRVEPVGVGSGVSAVVGVGVGVVGVVAVVVGPAGRRRGVGLVVELSERRGVVGGGVHVRLLQRRRVEVGALVR